MQGLMYTRTYVLYSSEIGEVGASTQPPTMIRTPDNTNPPGLRIIVHVHRLVFYHHHHHDLHLHLHLHDLHDLHLLHQNFPKLYRQLL